MLDTVVRCSECGKEFSPDSPIWSCDACGSLLEIPSRTDAPQLKDRLLSAAASGPVRGVWRYADLIPVDSARAVSMGEGDTPVVALAALGRDLGVPRLYAKLEYFSPTGSFKDRGTTVMVSKARELGVERLVEDSSGNAGASFAAYCARAGIKASIYVPASAPEEKKAQIGFYGAEVVAIEGTRDDVTEAAVERCRHEGAYYGSHNVNPFFLEGTKTFAYEVAGAFGYDPPEHLVMPVGNGSLLLGTHKGMAEMLAMGAIPRAPRLHVAQAVGCMPIVHAYGRGLERTERIPTFPTIAGGISIGKPSRGMMILRAMRETGGGGAAATDQQILAAQRRLAALEGIFCEPTSAAAIAVLPAMVERGIIDPGERVLIAITGSGLKDVGAISGGAKV